MISKLPIPLPGGVDLFSDPAAIPDGFHQRFQNLAPRANGIIGRRASLTFSQEVVPSWWHWDARTGEGFSGIADAVPHYYRWAKYLRPLKFIFDPNYGNITMVVVATQAVTVQGVTTEFSGGSFLRTASEQTVEAGTMLLLCLPGVMNFGSAATEPVLRCAILGQADRIPSLFTFNGVTYCVGGNNCGAQLVDAVRAGDALNAPLLPVNFDYATNYFGSANGNFIPQGAAVVRDRVVYFIGPNLYWSDRQEPETVGTTGAYDANGVPVPSTTVPPTGTNFPAIGIRDVMVGANAQDNIIAVAEVSTSANGSPQQSVVMAWTATNCYMILGEPLETTEGGDVIGSLQVNKLNVEAGCVSQASVTNTPYGTFWVGSDDVWFMPFGSLPIRVGTKIRPYLLNQPRGLLWRIHAEYVNGTYMVAMFRDGQGPSAWDPCNVHFWLDLKSGPPQDATSARWFGPQLINQTDCPASNGSYGGVGGTFCMSRDLRANGDGKTYTLQPFIIREIGGDAVVGLSLCSFDTFDDKDTTAPQRPRTAPWQPGYFYYEGDEIVPTPNPAGGLTCAVYTVAVSGQSGLTEPNWYVPAGDGQLVDGTVTWECRYFDKTGGAILSGYDRSLAQSGVTIGTYNNMIEWSLLSKEYVFDIDHEVLLDGCEIVATLGDATQLTYNTHPDQDSRSRIWTPNFTTITTLDTTAFERRWQRKLLTPSPTKRFNALSGMLEIKQNAGIVITTGVNDTWVMTVGGTPYTITIPAGFYTNIYTLSIALKAAYATATGSVLVTSLDAGGFNTSATFRVKDATHTLALATNSELAEIFGYLPGQPISSAIANVEIAGTDSPAVNYVPDMLLSALFLRHSEFKRDPE